MKLDITPNGIRVQIFLVWEVDTEFRSTWENWLVQCAHIIIDMLIEHDRVLLTQTKSKIKILETKLTSRQQSRKVSSFKTRLKEGIAKYEEEVVKKKKHKFHKDKLDFDWGTAWTH